jgi:hypothetical protein
MGGLNLFKFILVFIATGVGDMFWTFYIRRTSEGRALQASLFSAAIMIAGGIVIITYVENKWYLIPATLGAFVGTYLTVKKDSRHLTK